MHKTFQSQDYDQNHFSKMKILFTSEVNVNIKNLFCINTSSVHSSSKSNNATDGYG